MSCNKCKNKKGPNEQFMSKVSAIEKIVIITLAVLLVLSSYGIYSLIKNVI